MKMIKKLPLSVIFNTFALFFLTQSSFAADTVGVAQVVDNKKLKSLLPSEFKQAVASYIKRADSLHQTIGENSVYKKELRYLLKHYGKFSVSTLLSRVCSAHQEMIKQENNKENDAYQRYEKICSALLLVCAQVLFNETRSHILEALHEVDNLLSYWRYQRNHPLQYFFSKSPVKWVIGKEQAKEISYNIARLERKQKELYTLLGSIIGHTHTFGALDGTYQACYVWIEQLLHIIKCSFNVSHSSICESSFDQCATQLESRFKHIKGFKSECLSSLAGAKKSNHFVRNWVRYTALCAITAYMIHYGSKNPEVINSAFNIVQDEASKFVILLLHPLQKIYERGKLVFSDEKKPEEPKKPQNNESGELSIDREAQLMELVERIKKAGEGAVSAIAKEVEKSNTTIRESGLKSIEDTLSKVDSQTKENIGQALKKIEIIVEPIKVGEEITNQKEVDEYRQAFSEVLKYANDFSQSSWCVTSGSRSSWWDVNAGAFSIFLDDGYLNPGLKYTEIIDNNILPIFQISAEIAENLSLQADGLIKQANDLEIAFAQQLKDHELTLMFTSLIPLGIIALGTSKLYQWSISRDYSPIRIALAEVNSLLIEADNYADDHYYGKLIYLICKLRHKSEKLKDPMTNEFLEDVAKLESKQYSAPTKHAMVENMFNKYAFLGKVTA